MKKFEFRLQTLLDIREAREKEVKNELAKLLGVQNRERAKQSDLRDSIQREREKFKEKMIKGAYSLNEAMMYERFVDVSLRAIDTAQDRIESMEPAVREVRERLVEASKEKRVVEKLKEKKLREYDYELNREMTKENDDINQNIFNRRIME